MQSNFFEIFPWDSNFETGIAVVDEQHQRLVAILNQLAAHLANRASQVELDRVYDDLAAYADYHFRAEEQIWRQHFGDDPWFKGHEKTHHGFIAEVVRLKQNDSDQDYDDVIKEIVSFLTQWLAAHILDSDRRMAKVVALLEAGQPLAAAKHEANVQMGGATRILIETVLKMYDKISTRSVELMREKALRKAAEQALFESEQRRRFLLEGKGEDVWDWQVDKGRDRFSRGDAELYDIVGSRLIQAEGEGRIHPADLAAVKADFQAHLDGKTEFYINKHRILRDNGGWSWVLSKGKVISRDADGNPLRMIGTDADITERELGALIYRESSQGMFVTDVHNDIIAINPAFTRVTGFNEADVIGKNPRVLSTSPDQSELHQDMWASLTANGHWEGEIQNRHKHGRPYIAALTVNTVRDHDGDVDHYIGLISDITERKEAEDLIVRQANYDALTGLPNRQLFQNLLTKEIDRAKRLRSKFALLFMDLDDFKDINDTLSHEAGDRLLAEAARRMSGCVREADTVARFGGDEFTVAIGNIGDGASVERIVDDIIDALRRPFLIDAHQVHISASIGITIYPTDGGDVDALLRNADQAMYQAKRLGRGRYCYFTPAMQHAAIERRKLLNDAHQALEQELFQIHYQPIVGFSDQKVAKAEALLRWRHPTRGLVMPMEIVRLAEESGLILSIGEWIFQQAIAQALSWRQRIDPGFQINVNKSPVQLRNPGTLDSWLTQLRAAHLPGSNIAIEITEDVMLQCNGDMRGQLLKLHDAGVEVALDDFGTGYSSLAYLKDLHVDYIKIDKSFVSNLATGDRERALCEAMIVMAHKLGLQVVAEGVETEAHYRTLAAMGCDYGQGFYFSPPLPAADFEQRFMAA